LLASVESLFQLLFCLAFIPGREYVNGWPIPKATDIAITLGILAITIIAVFFAEDTQPVWLMVTLDFMAI